MVELATPIPAKPKALNGARDLRSFNNVNGKIAVTVTTHSTRVRGRDIKLDNESARIIEKARQLKNVLSEMTHVTAEECCPTDLSHAC